MQHDRHWKVTRIRLSTKSVIIHASMKRQRRGAQRLVYRIDAPSPDCLISCIVFSGSKLITEPVVDAQRKASMFQAPGHPLTKVARIGLSVRSVIIHAGQHAPFKQFSFEEVTVNRQAS